MKINQININGFGSELEKLQKQNKSRESQFGEMFQGFVKGVNNQQMDADKKTSDFIKGINDVEIHDVMIAAQKAKTSLQLLTEIRNKSLDMYKELTRMT